MAARTLAREKDVDPYEPSCGGMIFVLLQDCVRGGDSSQLIERFVGVVDFDCAYQLSIGVELERSIHRHGSASPARSTAGELRLPGNGLTEERQWRAISRSRGVLAMSRAVQERILRRAHSSLCALPYMDNQSFTSKAVQEEGTHQR